VFLTQNSKGFKFMFEKDLKMALKKRKEKKTLPLPI